MTSEVIRSPELLHRHSSRLVIVDVQEKLVAALPAITAARLISSCRFLAEGAQILGVPTVITEQYPQGLGMTVEPLQAYCPVRPAKKRFSAADCLGWPTASDPANDRFQVVVAGMETHVCVLQTVLDLLAAGYQVSVVADAVASRSPADETVASNRLAASGATITTAEAVLFEWTESAEAAEFKQISQLVKARVI